MPGWAAAPQAGRVIDENGLTLSPGFVDAHSHDEVQHLHNPSYAEKILQGVTTELIGNCGMSFTPVSRAHREHVRQVLEVIGRRYAPDELWGLTSFAEVLATLAAANPAMNVASLLGHGVLRAAIMGLEDRPPTSAERPEMKRRRRRAMEAGPFGLSIVLILVPSSFAETEEIIELARVVGQHRGVYARHLRIESDHQFEALEEALRIGRHGSAGPRGAP